MGVKGIFKFFLRRAFEVFVIAAFLVLIPNLPPYAEFSKPINVAPAKPFTGKLSLNNRLDDVELWHKGDISGPEAFDDLNGELYTSLYSGDIVKFTGERITPVVKFGRPCKGAYEESICGRPLGLQFDQNGDLYAADAYYGLFKVDVKTGSKQQLISPSTKIAGKPVKLFNSVAVASNGDIYWTDSSNFTLEDGLFSFLSDASGRLIHYDSKTKRNQVLINDLHFANGLALSENEDFVIVADTLTSSIHRYYLKGPKKGTRDIFIDGLPGLPDNIKADGKGGFLVPLVMSRDAEHPFLIQSIGPFRFIRKALARFMGIVQLAFKKIDQYYPNDFSVKVVHNVGHFTVMPSFLKPKRATLLRVNKNGDITDSVHTFKEISGISEMHVFKDTLYLGSPWNDYIGRISLAKLGWGDLKQEERVKRAAPIEAPKPTTTTPKPTTTTPKPTTTTTTTPKPTTTTPKPTTTTTPKPTTTTPKPTTTTPKPTTTTPKPTTTTPKPTTTTPKPTTTTPKPTTTTPKPTTTTPKPTTAKPQTTTTSKPSTTTTTPKPQTTQKPATTPPPTKPTTQASPKSSNQEPVKEQVPPPKRAEAQQAPPPLKQAPPQGQQGDRKPVQQKEERTPQNKRE